MKPFQNAQVIAEAAVEKKAREIIIMDMQELTPIVDFHIICDATNKKQVQAIADNIADKMTETGCAPLRTEGYREGRWILLDFGDCVAHVFHSEDRQFYDIEGLWNDAKIERISA